MGVTRHRLCYTTLPSTNIHVLLPIFDDQLPVTTRHNIVIWYPAYLDDQPDTITGVLGIGNALPEPPLQLEVVLLSVEDIMDGE